MLTEYSPEVGALDLSDQRLDDLSFINGLTDLQSLDISGTQVIDLSPLKDLSSLRSLDISDTPVSDLSPLMGLSGLQSLFISGSQVSDLSPLRELTGLQSLYMWGTQVNDLSPVEGLTNLQSLDISDTHVTSLWPLSTLTGLQSLNIGGTPVSDLAPLGNLTCLQSLYMWGTQVRDLSPLENLLASGVLHELRVDPESTGVLPSYVSPTSIYPPRGIAPSMLNPYVAGNPIQSEKGFFGRAAIFKDVERILSHPETNAIVLYGQRRIGKTSILLQLKRRLATTRRYTPIYFDLQDKSSRTLESLLYDLACRIGEAVPVPLPRAELLTASAFKDSFLPSAVKEAKGSLVLLLDEFDVLDSSGDASAGRELFPYLRALMSSVLKVNFVFVVGRRPEDMSIDTLSTFKGVRAARVSRLDRRESEAMIRQSETDETLRWDAAAENAIWQLCQGHAYLTQLICSVIYDNAAENEPPLRQVERGDVERAIETALQQGANAFHWIWEGLPPAERVVTAAMAESNDEVISHDDLISILNRSGVRLIVRELELAPETLVQWEILEETEGGYRFVVPLVRRWVYKHRPLRRVKDELDRLDPLAEGLFKTGQHFYQLAHKTEAEGQLRQSLIINPNHLKSKLLLGRILLESGRIPESVTLLEEAFAYDQAAARPDFIRVLIASAEDKEDPDERRATYQRILSYDPHQNIATERLAALEREQRMERLAMTELNALSAEERLDWREAANLYRWLVSEEPNHAPWIERLAAVTELDVVRSGIEIEEAIATESWTPALALVAKATECYPGRIEWAAYHHTIAIEQRLAADYAQARLAYEAGQLGKALKHAVEVVVQRPTYKDSLEFLLLCAKGKDVAGIEREVIQLREKCTFLDAELLAYRDPLDPRDAQMRRLRELAILVGSPNPEAFLSCPGCDVKLKAKNLLRHILHEHGEPKHEH